MIIKNVELETVCGITSKLPDNQLCEIAFAGKSNVGKSSLINGLVNRKALARTSSQPGKTQTINFYNVNKELYFVDLPGYGYANVSLKVKEQWGKMIERYLHESQVLKAVFLLIDIRHEPSANDVNMYQWILANGYEPIIIATKADKIKRSQLQTVKTMIHEIAHAMLHADNDKVERKDAGTREVEAESIAYVVCQYLGLDTSDYSFAYLIGWSSGRQMPELRASLHTIQTTAADLIDRIEEQIRKAEPEDSGQETSDVAGDYFEIYQLKENMENRQFYFMDLSFWQSRGLPVEHTRYDVTYTASLDEKTTLDDIYCRFNIDRPSDFFGHSLSVSDVVVLHRKGKTDSYFVDNIGFQPVTDFFKKEPKDVAV